MSRREARCGHDDAGFTLVELMTALLIIAVLVMIAIPSYVAARETAAAEACAANRSLGAQADYRLYLDTGAWSGSFADLDGEYLNRSLTCPSGGTLVWLEEPSEENPYRLLGCSIHGVGTASTGDTSTEAPIDTWRRVSTNIIDLIEQFRQDTNHWPRSHEPENYTDLGLDPADYAEPQGHLYYTPDGNRLTVAPESGWVVQVTTGNGDTRTVSSDENEELIYDVKSGDWYYGSVSGKNMVDIDSMLITESSGEND